MKKTKVLLAVVPLFAILLSGCDSALQYAQSFDYVDKNGYRYHVDITPNPYQGAYGASLIGVKKGTKKVIVPDAINGVPVTSVTLPRSNNLSAYSTVESLTLGKNVKRFLRGDYYYNESSNDIPWDSFCGDQWKQEDEQSFFPSLKTLSLEKSQLEYIPIRAFYRCSELEEITFNDSLKYIYVGAFEECSKLKNVSLPKDLLAIGDSAFANCSLIDNDLVLPNNLIDLGAAFENTGIIDDYSSEPSEDIVLKTYDGKNCLISAKMIDFVSDRNIVIDAYDVIGSYSIETRYSYYDEGSLTFNARVISHYAFGRQDGDEYYHNTPSVSQTTLNFKGTLYINDYAFQTGNVRYLNIDSDIQHLSEHSFYFTSLETVNVINNPSQKYFVYDNVLYEKNATGSSLLLVPERNPNRSLTLAPDANGIAFSSYSYSTYSPHVYDYIGVYNQNLETMYMSDGPSGYPRLLDYFQTFFTKEYRLIDHSENFRIVDGAICNKDTLLKFPQYKPVDVYQTEPSLTVIGEKSFLYQTTVKTIKISRTVKTIWSNAFSQMVSDSTLFSIYIPKEVGTIYYLSSVHENKVVIYTDAETYQPGWREDCFANFTVNWGYQLDY